MKDSLSLRFLYRTVPGRCILKLLTARGLSKAAGAFLDSSLSRPLIRPFIISNHIDLSEYEACDYKCFNECFCRKIKAEKRPFDSNPSHLISPCDGLLSVYRITDDLIIPVKQSSYSVSSLLQNSQLAQEFNDGWCLVFRLCVNHYHRYCYPASGRKTKNIFIPGVLHTVRPIALETYPVFTENCREYTILDTENFGRIVQMEAGAMLVGRICNYHQEKIVSKGEEKGRFEYGGSTIILLLDRNHMPLKELLNHNEEIPVKMGMRIQ